MTDERRILVLGGSSSPLAELVARYDDVEVVADLTQCLTELQTAARPVSLVVIDTRWPQPFATALQVRRVDAAVRLAFAAPSNEVDEMRSRLAFLPDAGDAGVVAVDEGAAEPPSELAELIRSSKQRHRVRGALDAINRDLAAGSSNWTATGGPSSVSEHYLAALVRHAADAILSLDPDGRVMTINEAAQRLLDLDPTAIEGRPIGELLAAEDDGSLLHLLDAAAGGQAQAADELPLHLRHGHQLLLSATVAPILDDVGAIVGLAIVARDISGERHAAQQLQALQKAESLATLATGVAHDFNNLLARAHGWAELARDDLEDTELVSSALDNIAEATNHASELARSLLAYGGRGRFETKPVRIAALISDLQPLLTSMVPAKITLDLHIEVDPQVEGDPVQLRQVFLNLVLNAVEAIDDHAGTITIRVDVEPRDAQLPSASAPSPPSPSPSAPSSPSPSASPSASPSWSPSASSSHAVIEFEDSGPGIDADVEARLFDPFFTTKFTGRGLGLAAGQGIVHAHGGTITVDGRPGVGARFRVRLPMTS